MIAPAPGFARGGAPAAPASARGVLLMVALALGPAACSGDRSGDGREVARSGIATAGSSGPGRPLTAEEQAGEAVYRRENCARCHTLFDTPPSGGPFNPPAPWTPGALDGRVGPDLGLEGHRRSDDWHLAHLYAPDVVVTGSRMTAYRHLFRPGRDGRPLPTHEAAALVAWLQTLGRDRRDVWAETRLREPVVPAPDGRPDGERLAHGDRLYARHCVACHGVAGDGRGPAAALLARQPRDFTIGVYRFRSTPAGEAPRDADLFRSITIGAGTGGAMPGFGHLEAEERWALVRRIREFAPALRGRGVDFDARRDGGVAPPSADGDPPGPQPGGDRAGPGRALFAELGCAACHGESGEGRPAPGDGESWRDEGGRPIPATGDLRHACGLRGGASEAAFARALENGVGPVMPSFGPSLAGRPAAPGTIRAWLLSLDADRGAAAATPGGP